MLTATVVWIAYLSGTGLVAASLARIRFAALRFVDGILIGYAYYVSVPMLFVLAHGSMPADFLDTRPYRPFQDLGTSAVLIGAGYLLAALCAAVPRARVTNRADSRFLPAIVLIWAGSSAYGFVNSGIASGAHWYLAADAALASDPAFLLTKHISNFARTALFGVLVHQVERGLLPRMRATGIGTAIALLDLATTFNRITLAYLLVAVFILYRRNLLVLASLTVLLFTAIPAVSNAWPMFRGLASTAGYHPDALARAAATAVDRTGAEGPLVLTLNGVFESVNLVALNHVVRHAGERGLEFRPGEMFVRPLTFYLPSMIWPDRPEGLGTGLGYAINRDRHLALNSTLLGEPYINFAAYWWAALALLLLLYEAAFRALGKRSGVVGAVAAFIGFAMWRFDPVFGVIAMVLTALVLIALRIMPRRIGPPPPRRAMWSHFP